MKRIPRKVLRRPNSWSPNRVPHGFPPQLRIPRARSNLYLPTTPSVTKSDSLAPVPPLSSHISPPISDEPGYPVCTLGVAAASTNLLPVLDFPSWAVARRHQMVFDCAGGILALNRAEDQSAKLTTTGPTSSERARQGILIKRVEGAFMIPPSIATPRVSVLTAADSLYVQRIFRYLADIADDLSKPRGVLSVPLRHYIALHVGAP